MNKYLFILFFSLTDLFLFSQDTIFLKNTLVELAVIQKNTESQIYYKKHSNPNGTLYIINKYEINKIKFHDGSIIAFDSVKFINPNISRSNITKIDYKTVKKEYNKLSEFVDQRVSLKNREQLYIKASVVTRHSRQQVATRVGVVTFASLAAASCLVLGFDYIVTFGNPDDIFYVPPVSFAFCTLTFATSNFFINQKLRQKRKSFVALYNDL